MKALYQTTAFVRAHASGILTGLAVVGAVGTAVLTAQSTLKARAVLDGEQLTEAPLSDQIRRVWTLYIPPLSLLAVTVGAIVGAHSINASRVASAVSVASVAQTNFDAYKRAARQVVGQDKEEEIRAKTPAQRCTEPVPQTLEITEGEQLCFEAYSGRFFVSSVEEIHRAVNVVNNNINHDFAAPINDLYSELGLPVTKYGWDVGWNSDNLIAPEFASALDEQKRPYLVLDYTIGPSATYDRTW